MVLMTYWGYYWPLIVTGRAFTYMFRRMRSAASFAACCHHVAISLHHAAPRFGISSEVPGRAAGKQDSSGDIPMGLRPAFCK